MTEFSYTSVAQQVIFGIGTVNQFSEAVARAIGLNGESDSEMAEKAAQAVYEMGI